MAEKYEGMCSIEYTGKDEIRYSHESAHREVTIHDDGSITTFRPVTGVQEHFPNACAPMVRWPWGRTSKK